MRIELTKIEQKKSEEKLQGTRIWKYDKLVQYMYSHSNRVCDCIFMVTRTIFPCYPLLQIDLRTVMSVTITQNWLYKSTYIVQTWISKLPLWAQVKFRILVLNLYCCDFHCYFILNVIVLFFLFILFCFVVVSSTLLNVCSNS